ncbi:MAG: pyridoxal phosphate-dependent aminotransferase [Gemmatimonadales bacterium]
MQISAQVAGLGTEAALEVLAKTRRLEAAGRKIIHLEVGEPNFPTPPHIVEAGIAALRDGHTKYVPAAGLPDLRVAIADTARLHGIPAGPANVIVTSGAKPMLFYALLALLEPGDEALVPDPGFPTYESLVRFAGARPVPYRVDPYHARPVDPAELAEAITGRTRVLVLNSPHNPTGVVLDERTVAALAELAVRHDLQVVSDEVYGRITYGRPHISIASRPGMPERTAVVDGFSKTYCMTGWRLGYGIMPEPLARRIERFVMNSTTCAPGFVQQAGLAALIGSQECVTAMCGELESRRVFLAGALRAASIACAVPDGAFYLFPRVADILHSLGLTAQEYTEWLLEEHGLACVPGTAFGAGGEGSLRLSFAVSRRSLLDAVPAFGSTGTVRGRPHGIVFRPRLPEADNDPV